MDLTDVASLASEHAAAQAHENAWREYESRKTAFKFANPGASSDQYEDFIRTLVEELGL